MDQRQESLVKMFRDALEQAEQGKIRSAIMVTMCHDGHLGYWSRINSQKDEAAAIGHLEILRSQMVDEQKARVFQK